MTKCSLSIEILDDGDFVPAGGELEVVVHVRCRAKTECGGLSLTRGWRTHGRGNRDQGGQRMEELFRGTWEEGEYAYPATVPFPSGPRSYHGQALNVDWYLSARADIPMAIDPRAEELVLVVDPSLPRAYEPPDIWAPSPIALTSGISGAVVLTWVAILVVLLLLFASGPGWSVLLIPLAAHLIVSRRRSQAAKQAMGRVALDLHPNVIQPGEELHVVVELEPEIEIDIEHATLTLVAEEEATSGSGTNTTEHVEEALKIEHVLQKNVALSPTERFSEEVTFALPITAPFTFQASDNKVTTRLQLEIQPVNGKALRCSRPVQVGTPLD